jgi:plastocyanin
VSFRSPHAAIALAALALAVAGCGEPDPDRSPGPKDLEGYDFDAAATIEVTEEGFEPVEVTVLEGEVILLVNAGEEPHRFDGGEAFDMGTLAPGQRQTLILDEPGEYDYVDRLDPDHEGTITVEPSGKTED